MSGHIFFSVAVAAAAFAFTLLFFKTTRAEIALATKKFPPLRRTTARSVLNIRLYYTLARARARTHTHTHIFFRCLKKRKRGKRNYSPRELRVRLHSLRYTSATSTPHNLYRRALANIERKAPTYTHTHTHTHNGPRTQ